jgi:hypothetical protein
MPHTNSLSAVIATALTAAASHAQIAHFDQPTDTIRVIGNTTLGSAFTYYEYSASAGKDACPDPILESDANRRTNYNFERGLDEMMSISDNRTTRGVVLRYGMSAINATGSALTNVPGNVGFTPDIDTPQTKAFVSAFKAKYNRLPSDTEGQAYNGAMVLFQGVTLAKSVKPEDVTKALRGATVDTLYGKAPVRAADNQMVIPNYVARVKTADGMLRPVIERSFPASITPAASPACKM